MSDFWKGVGTGLVGGGANGIAGGIQKLALTPYLVAAQEQKARSEAALRAYREAHAADLQYGLDRRNEMLNAYKANPNDLNAKILAYSKFSDANDVANAMITGIRADAYNRIVNPETGADGKPVDTTDLLGRFNRASMALKGEGFANGRGPGMVLDPLTGRLIVGNPELHKADLGERYSRIRENNAQAGVAGSGWLQVVDGGDGGYQVVNKRDGRAVTVTNNGNTVKAPKKGKSGAWGDYAGYKPSEYDDMLIDLVKAGKLNKAQAIQMSKAQK